MLFDIIYMQKFSWETILVSLLGSLVVVFLTLPIHEWAHGVMANKLGDPTAKYSGRLSLNPLKHLDPLGTALIFLIGFGWAKPVPVNPHNFKNPKKDMAITAIAGPLSNIIMAFIFLLLGYCGLFFAVKQGMGTQAAILAMCGSICIIVAEINVSLAVFNLIPVPPLDGSRVLGAFLSDRTYYKLMQYERYSSFIIIAIVMGTDFIGNFSVKILEIFSRIAILPFPDWFARYMYII